METLQLGKRPGDEASKGGDPLTTDVSQEPRVYPGDRETHRAVAASRNAHSATENSMLGATIAVPHAEAAKAHEHAEKMHESAAWANRNGDSFRYKAHRAAERYHREMAQTHRALVSPV